MKMIHTPLALATVLAALTLAAPVSAGDSMKPSTMKDSLQDLSGAEFDQRFLAVMRGHHEHGIEMAMLAKKRAQGDAIRQFAAKVTSSQQKDIGEIERVIGDAPGSAGPSHMATSNMGTGATHAAATEAPSAGSSGTAAKHAMAAPQDEMQDDMMQKLESATGAEFDRQFVEHMTRHHKHGLEIAQLATTRATREEVKQLAQKLVREQQAELDELMQLKSS